MPLSPHAFAALKQAVAQAAPAPAWPRFSLGLPALDGPLGGGLARGALHEFQAAGPGDLAALAGFAIAMAIRAAGSRPILWVRQDRLDHEAGAPYPPGLAAFGLDPGRLVLVRAPDPASLLRVAAEAARCPALGAVLVAPWQAGRLLDLTASRRLVLAAEASGVTLLLTRMPGPPAPSAAHSRWRVAALPSPALAANAAGRPSPSACAVIAAAWRNVSGPWSGIVTEPVSRTPAPALMPALPRRYLALWFPFLPTDRLRREQPASTGAGAPPRVVTEKRHGARVLAAVDHAALQLGLRAGMTLADARARIPQLALAEAAPERDAALIGRLAALCDLYTPLVADDAPYGLMLDITGCAHLFGGEAALRETLAARLRRLGFFARLGLAGTPDAARAFARFAAHPAPQGAGEEQAARALPVAALEAAPEATLALTRAGLVTLGSVDARPRATLAARFGAGLVTRLQRILGREDRRITPLRPPPACIVERHFPEPFLDQTAIAGVLERLIAEAGRVLEGRGAGGRVFEASFFRSDGAVRRLTVETGRPLRDAGAVMRLYRERLDSLADPLDPGFGFDAIRLAVPVCESLPERQPDLAGGTDQGEALDDLVDRLSTRLGRDRVLRFAAGDSHQAERAFHAWPAAARGAPSAALTCTALAWPEQEPGEPPARPLQLFRSPEPIEALAEVPDGPPSRFRWRRESHAVARAEGPERIAPDWWRDGPDALTRDYYRVEDMAGRRFWLFRQGFYGAGDAAPRWFVHGVFA